MQTFYNPDHQLHQGQQEMFRGRLVPCHEAPARLNFVLNELQARPLGTLQVPKIDDATLDQAIHRVHTPRYTEFLAQAWDDWVSLDPSNAQRDALPSVWPLPNRYGFRVDRQPNHIAARLGMFAFDAGTPLMAGSWKAARRGAACAVAAAQRLLAGERSTFALTRPPGHHAGPDFMGGYCFLNNAAIAAQVLRDGGCARVAVLDIDYHHGNGTQTIFYERPDVFTLSIHGDPTTEYPFLLGHADEAGVGVGHGYNLNLPLPRGTSFADWQAALAHALSAVNAYQADALVVPMGLDTFEGDPICGFRLQSADYTLIGQMLAELGLPTVFTFEGGYAVAELGVHAVNLLHGFATTAAAQQPSLPFPRAASISTLLQPFAPTPPTLADAALSITEPDIDIPLLPEDDAAPITPTFLLEEKEDQNSNSNSNSNLNTNQLFNNQELTQKEPIHNEHVHNEYIQYIQKDPLHGKTLQHIIEELVADYGWVGLGKRIPVRCFTLDPSVGSSLKFLRKTPWAREKVEQLYAYTQNKKQRRTQK